jgi:DNA-binding transcriptional ArsR family regulator
MHSTDTSPDIFGTLADPMRRRIVEALLGGEQAVNDIVERLDIHQSGVSRHLRILSEAGFVQVRPDGPKRLYSLRPEPFRELDAWVTRYRRLWESRLDRFAAELARRQKVRATKRKERPS